LQPDVPAHKFKQAAKLFPKLVPMTVSPEEEHAVLHSTLNVFPPVVKGPLVTPLHAGGATVAVAVTVVVVLLVTTVVDIDVTVAVTDE